MIRERQQRTNDDWSLVLSFHADHGTGLVESFELSLKSIGGLGRAAREAIYLAIYRSNYSILLFVLFCSIPQFNDLYSCCVLLVVVSGGPLGGDSMITTCIRARPHPHTWWRVRCTFLSRLPRACPTLSNTVIVIHGEGRGGEFGYGFLRGYRKLKIDGPFSHYLLISFDWLLS